MMDGPELVLARQINPIYLENYPWQSILSASNIGLANQTIAQRVILPVSGVISRLDIYIGTSNGNVDAGLYEWNGSAFVPLWRAGSTAAAASGSVQSFTPNLGVSVGKELWIPVAQDNATVTFGRGGSGTWAQVSAAIAAADTPKVAWAKTSSFPLPTSFAAGDVTSAGSVLPWIRLKIT